MLDLLSNSQRSLIRSVVFITLGDGSPAVDAEHLRDLFALPNLESMTLSSVAKSTVSTMTSVASSKVRLLRLAPSKEAPHIHEALALPSQLEDLWINATDLTTNGWVGLSRTLSQHRPTLQKLTISLDDQPLEYRRTGLIDLWAFSNLQALQIHEVFLLHGDAHTWPAFVSPNVLDLLSKGLLSLTIQFHRSLSRLDNLDFGWVNGAAWTKRSYGLPIETLNLLTSAGFEDVDFDEPYDAYSDIHRDDYHEMSLEDVCY